ncbi:hypothetical protein RvY_02879, partial [Ramazzottius varieornatus]
LHRPRHSLFLGARGLMRPSNITIPKVVSGENRRFFIFLRTGKPHVETGSYSTSVYRRKRWSEAPLLSKTLCDGFLRTKCGQPEVSQKDNQCTATTYLRGLESVSSFTLRVFILRKKCRLSVAGGSRRKDSGRPCTKSLRYGNHGAFPMSVLNRLSHMKILGYTIVVLFGLIFQAHISGSRLTTVPSMDIACARCRSTAG